jgi:hypothetical protein
MLGSRVVGETTSPSPWGSNLARKIAKHSDFLGPKAITQVLMVEDKNCACNWKNHVAIYK